MKPISPFLVQWPARAAGGAKPGWVLLAMMMAASSTMLVVAAEMPISTVQEMLKREQFFYGEPSGVLDEPTHAALRRFQIRYGLPVSGEIDKATVQALQGPREKDAAGAPAPVAGENSKAGSASTTTNEKDREFLQDLQQSGTGPGKAPAEVPPSAPALAAPQVTGEGTARIVGRRTIVDDDAVVPPGTGAPANEPTRRVITRTTTTIVTGATETDDDPDPLGPHGVRIIRPPGAVPAPATAPPAPQEQTRIVEERRTTTLSPATPPPARAPATGLPIYPQTDEPPSRVLPEAPPRKPQGFLQKLFRGDR